MLLRIFHYMMYIRYVKSKCLQARKLLRSIPIRSGCCPAVEARGVSRMFKVRKSPLKCALRDLSFAFGPGDVLSVVGPNGAGKTTLIRILTTLLEPTSGQALVHGFDVAGQPKAVRPLIGTVLAGSGGLMPRGTAMENLAFFGALYKMPRRDAVRRAGALLEQFGLSDARDLRVNTFSSGMRQRLLLARAMMHNPSVLLLDEPTNGLDPEAAMSFRRLVSDLRSRGTAILFCSHNMNEVAALSDEVIVLVEGRVIASGSPTSIAQQAGGLVTVALDIPNQHTGRVPELTALSGVISHTQTHDESRTRLRLLTFRPDALEAEALRLLGGSGGVFREPATLEDAYLHLAHAHRHNGG
jgi:ABC-2 type transport system ATP-binding protein